MSFNLKIPAYVSGVMNTLEGAGYECYAVGGCVRDSIMGAEPHDWDLCTDARPEETAGLFPSYHVLGYGMKHGTVTVVSEGRPVEITTYRTDGEYKDGRRPENVEFVRNITDDLSRRDFTVNAIAYSPKIGLADPFGGIEDIKAGIVRAVGSPSERFGEDALRIMRALRFSCCLGFEIEKETSKAVHEMKGLLDRISRERTTGELMRILSSDGCGKTFGEYFDVLMQIIPFLEADRKETLVKKLRASGNSVVLRLALITEGYGYEKINITAGMMKWDSKTRKAVQNAAADSAAEFPGDFRGMCRLVREIGHERFSVALEMKKASGEDTREAEEIYGKILESGICLFKENLAVNGRDLLSAGIKKETIGALLDCLLDKIADGEISNDRAALLREAERIGNSLS